MRCYPAKALHLTNCKIGKDGDLILIRSKVPPAELKEYDIHMKLMAIGFCPYCAVEAASDYMKNPHSQQSKLIQRAIKGNKKAIEKLCEGGCNPVK